MGSRAGYMTQDKNGYSQIFRKQWACSIEELVTKMWATLSEGKEPGNGSQAIRNDLNNGRAFAALVICAYDKPFDSVEVDTHCDISDNGLFTIDVSDWKNWKVYNNSIGWEESEEGKLGESVLLAMMDSENGFQWVVDEEQRKEIGEGIF